MFGAKWPACASEMTDEVAAGLRMSESLYNLRTAAVAEELRVQANDESGEGGGGFQCCWTNTFVRVTVK